MGKLTLKMCQECGEFLMMAPQAKVCDGCKAERRKLQAAIRYQSQEDKRRSAALSARYQQMRTAHAKIIHINQLARDAGMSYGRYVALMRCGMMPWVS